MTELTEESSTELDENQKDLDEDDQKGAPDGSEADEDPDTDGQEVEIVLQGADGSQPKRNPLGFTRRIRKLNATITAAEGEASQATTDLATEREKNKLLQLALDQKQAAPAAPPDPSDFDDGAKDPQYVAALNDFNGRDFDARMQRHTAAQPAPQPVVDRALERKQVEHYQAADKLKVKDYAETEDKAIAILGKTAVNILIESSDADVSVKVLNYLGKNPDRAEEIAAMLNGRGTLPAKGILALGALGATLVAKPKAKRNPAPDPDNELEGASVSRSGKKQTRGPKGAIYE